jgi:hypothetical protein
LPKSEQEDALANAVRDIIEQAKNLAVDGQTRLPTVLSGQEGAILSDNPHVVRWKANPPSSSELQEVARKPVRAGGFGSQTWSTGDFPVPLWLGRQFDVRSHAIAVLRRSPGNSALFFGAQAPIRLGVLASSLAGLASMVAPNTVELTVIDGLNETLPGGGMLRVAVDTMTGFGFNASCAGAESAEVTIERALEITRSRHEAGSAADAPSSLFVLSEPEYLTGLHAGQHTFGPPPEGAPANLREVIQRGPQVGVHLILTGSGLAAVSTILNPTRELRGFTHRVVQQMNEEDSMTLFASLQAARISEQADHTSAMLYVDLIQGIRAGYLFKGYATGRDVVAGATSEALARVFGELFHQANP